MDSFEMNKILGAVLGTCLMLVAMNIAAGAIFSPTTPAKPGYKIEVPEKKAGDSKGGSPQPAEPPIEQLLASADVGRGAGAAQKCTTCHAIEKDAKSPSVGPNLYSVIGRPKASVPGFNYSPALKSMGGTWTVEELNKFIANPKGMVPGTNMTFSGVPRPSERADIIAFLNSKSDNPVPLTKAAQAPGGTTPQ
jgi:cytochrome c